MADAADSKSVALKSVRVQVPPSAHIRNPVVERPQGFTLTELYPGTPVIGHCYHIVMIELTKRVTLLKRILAEGLSLIVEKVPFSPRVY